MEVIRKYFPQLTEQQTSQLTRLEPLYHGWNEKINVVSRKDIDQLYLRHVLHSLAIAKYIQFRPGAAILDVGTGGGFPGIPLAILFPQSRFVLVDSIGKKIKVVNAVAEDLGLKNCIGIHSRAEQIKEKFDFVVSRAVTTLPQFVSWVRKSINQQSGHALPNGILYLKGGDLSEELKLPYHTELINISEYFEEEFFETKKIVHVFIS